MALTDTKLKSLKPKEKQYKISDEKGLYVLVHTNGSRYWRMKYRFAGKEKTLSLGIYPDVTLAQARTSRDEARQQLAAGNDPSFTKQIKKRASAQAAQNSFESIAREWHANFLSKWTESHALRTLKRIEQNAFPWLGNKPITEINAPEILQVLRRVESRGAIETAHRIQQIISQVFRYAIITGRADRDPSNDLKGALKPVQTTHHASITDPREISKLLQAIEDYKGSTVTRLALKFAPLVFVRPGELRKAEWSEIDFDNAEWRIPAEKMKMRELHIVPLSQQAIEILEEIKPLTGHGKYIFPGIRTLNRPMSENTITGALRRLGYSGEEMTGHGFRSMACTLLNEQGYNRDVIERQMAHAERNNVRAAYNYAEYLPERRRMMQEWADYLRKLCIT